MNTDAARTTAKIYQFPVRGRLSGGGTRLDTRKSEILSGHAPVSFGSAWYHEAAVQEERSRKS